MTINANIEHLVKEIKEARLNKGSDSQLEFKQGLFNALKLIAKDKQVNVIELPIDIYLDVVKKRFNVTRSCAIAIVSKTDRKDIGSQIALIIPAENEDEEDINITYDQLTFDQMLTLDPTNINLELTIKELEYLQSLLPKQLTEDDMIDIINKNKLTNIKDIMSYFKLTYSNQYDSKLLSNIAKNIK